jgi:hypothetical protein
MATEFFHCKTVEFKAADYVNIDGKWFTYDELTNNQVNTLWLILFNVDRIRFYIRNLKNKGVTERIEQLRLAARHFFPLLNNTPDITDNGTVNIECHA